MKYPVWPLILLLILVSSRSSSADDPCLECHANKTPCIVNAWKKSAHFEKNIACADCHMLGELTEKRLKGEMTENDFEAAKKRILDEKGL